MTDSIAITVTDSIAITVTDSIAITVTDRIAITVTDSIARRIDRKVNGRRLHMRHVKLLPLVLYRIGYRSMAT